MRAARLQAYAPPAERPFAIEDVPRPTVEAPDDVVVEVEAAGWCHTDNHVLDGWFADRVDVELPYTPGHENAGVVAEVGDGVEAFAPGDPVVVHPAVTCGTCRACRLGEDMYCTDRSFSGLDTDGGFAEYLHTSERSLVALDGLGTAEAAPLADAGLTAYRAAKRAAADLDPGDRVLLVGIGGLGHLGLQALRALSPATTVAADVRPEALELADRLGADHTVDVRDAELPAAVADLTDGAGVHAVLDFVGSDETLAAGPRLMAPGGDHYIVGYEGELHLPARALTGGEWSLVSTLVGTYTELQELVALAEAGRVTVEVSTHDLADINEVAKRLEDGQVDGRAVLVP